LSGLLKRKEKGKREKIIFKDKQIFFSYIFSSIQILKSSHFLFSKPNQAKVTIYWGEKKVY